MISLQILCSGTHTPSDVRWGSAYALKMGNEWFMFDCGPAATYKLIKSKINPLDISNLFFTHIDLGDIILILSFKKLWHLYLLNVILDEKEFELMLRNFLRPENAKN